MASMLIPASPRIAASFASSPGRSGTSTSSWIMRVRPGKRMAFPRYKGSAPSLGGGALIEGGPLDRAIPMRYRLVYVGIQVQDMDRSVRFYTSALGMRVSRRQSVPETGGEWAELRSVESEQVLELNWYPEGSRFFKGPYRHGDELDHIAFECEDVEGAYRELLASGARAGHPPFEEGRSVLAYVVDPDGIWIELCAPSPGPGG